MPSYLIIETTGGVGLDQGPRTIVDAKSVPDAVALVIGQSYSYEQTFSVFDVSQSTAIKIEQEKLVRALDASDETDTTVLGEYTEADIEVLKEESAQVDPQVK